MSKPVTTQRNKSGAPNLHEVGSTPEPRIRRKEAKASPETSAQRTPASSARIAAPGEQAVRFDLFDPNARRAFLVGTFNDWQPEVTPLINSGDGNWKVELSLRPGTYEYRFVVDGRWIEDPKSSRFATNPFGGVNSVLEVEAPEGDTLAVRRRRGGAESPRRTAPKTRSWSVKPSAGDYRPEAPNR